MGIKLYKQIKDNPLSLKPIETKQNLWNAYSISVFNLPSLRQIERKKKPAAFVKISLFQEKYKHKTENQINAWWHLVSVDGVMPIWSGTKHFRRHMSPSNQVFSNATN